MSGVVTESSPGAEKSKDDPQFMRKRSVQMEGEEGVTSPPGTATAPAGSPEKEKQNVASKRDSTIRKSLHATF